MKKKQENHEEEVTRTLASLDNINRAEPAPFLYTRLISKLNNRKEPVQWSLPLAWKAVLVMLLLVNGLTFFVLTQKDSSEDSLEALSTDYFDRTDEVYTLNYATEE